VLRAQPPVFSPIPARALLAGLGALLGIGDRRAAVERRLKERLGAADLLLTDSGTTALGLAIRGALADRPGGAVAIPAYCCYDLATAVDCADVPAMLYDVDVETLGPAWDSVERVLGAGASALVIAHLYGVPVDAETAERKTASRGVPLIEDAAQAAGALVGGRPAGAWGDVAVLSFGRGKGTTGGGGGALIANRGRGPAILADARAGLGAGGAGAGALARLGAQWLLARPAIYGIPSGLPFLGLGQTVYRPPHPPRGAARVHTAVLEHTLGVEQREIETRRANAERLMAAAQSGGWMVPRSPVGGETWLRLPLVARHPLPETELAAARPLGVMRGYPRALAALRGFGHRVRHTGIRLPGARLLAERLVTAPTHGRLAERDLVALEAWLARPR
jgi:dTDP-4-amino-4,6-dideoxygalactose transaminase